MLEAFQLSTCFIKQQPVPVVFLGSQEKNEPCILGQDYDNVSCSSFFVNIFRFLEASVLLPFEPGYFSFLPVQAMCLIVLTGLQVAQLLCFITEVEKLR
jgi:hypothetical protein